jgi:hypothetical protein
VAINGKVHGPEKHYEIVPQHIAGKTVAAHKPSAEEEEE